MADEPEATEPAPEPTDTAGDAPDTAAELDKWRSLARKHEERAKANAAAVKELEQLKAQSMSDTEKAIAAARLEAAAEAAKVYGGRLVDAEVKAAAAGRPVDIDALLEGLDRTRFLGDDGDPDTAAIAAWVDRVAPAPEPEPTGPPRLDLGQGSRGAPIALGSDPLEQMLRNQLGIR